MNTQLVLGLLLLAMAAPTLAAGTVTATQIAIGQISLWLAFVLILTTIVVISSLGMMNYQTDTLLFQKSKDD